ncbi:MAG: acetyltransferase, gnat family [Paenibacillus sp.]|jgi:ribosomal protein S18 acetylase RimI-like enzyme|nr:acetyltransferase, gnat family [Paenibacillus sp.]
MLKPINHYPEDKEISGIHNIPMEQTPSVELNLKLEPHEVPDLRQSVGWERRDADFPGLLTQCLFWAGVRDDSGSLIAFGYITGPGIEHGYMEDIMVHPHYQKHGIGKALVRKLLNEANYRKISMVTVTYQEKHKLFYEDAGFTPCPGGIWRSEETV